MFQWPRIINYSDDVCVICCKQYARDRSEKLVKVTYSRVALMKCSIQHCNSELSETLDHLRYRMYMNIIATGKSGCDNYRHLPKSTEN